MLIRFEFFFCCCCYLFACLFVFVFFCFLLFSFRNRLEASLAVGGAQAGCLVIKSPVGKRSEIGIWLNGEGEDCTRINLILSHLFSHSLRFFECSFYLISYQLFSIIFFLFCLRFFLLLYFLFSFSFSFFPFNLCVFLFFSAGRFGASGGQVFGTDCGGMGSVCSGTTSSKSSSGEAYQLRDGK